MLPDTIPVVDAVPIDGNQGHGVPVVNIRAEDILLPDGGGDEPETGQPKAKKRRQRRPKEPEGGLGATSAMMASGATSGRHVTLGQLPLEIEALLMRCAGRACAGSYRCAALRTPHRRSQRVRQGLRRAGGRGREAYARALHREGGAATQDGRQLPAVGAVGDGRRRRRVPDGAPTGTAARPRRRRRGGGGSCLRNGRAAFNVMGGRR